MQTLKERRADTKADELISDFLNEITDQYLEEQIEKRTPENYYFEAARSIPEFREKIIQQARKALQRTDRALFNGMSAEPKESQKSEESVASVEIPQLTQ